MLSLPYCTDIPDSLQEAYLLYISIISRISRGCGKCGQPESSTTRGVLFLSTPKYRVGEEKIHAQPIVETTRTK
jgi:hypothetical protein